MYDVVIIGKGPAGVSAALYTVRANLRTLVVARGSSPVEKSEKISNYYGFPDGVSGPELIAKGEDQAMRLGAEFIRDEITGIEKLDMFYVKGSKDSYQARAVLIATGLPYGKMSVANMEKFIGKGVSYCPTCDGFFYKDMKVGVIGSRDFAIHQALELKTVTNDITIFTNGDKLYLTGHYVEAAKSFIINEKVILRLDGGEYLEKICFQDGAEEKADGIFLAFESAGGADFARQLGVVTNGTAIAVDNMQKTSKEGLFAAGDCTGGVRQISVAVGQGAVAGKKIIEYLYKI